MGKLYIILIENVCKNLSPKLRARWILLGNFAISPQNFNINPITLQILCELDSIPSFWPTGVYSFVLVEWQQMVRCCMPMVMQI